jgi:hypothetical protein
MKQFKPGDIAIWKPAVDRSVKGVVVPTEVEISNGPNRFSEYYVKRLARYGGQSSKQRTFRVKDKYLHATEIDNTGQVIT